MEDMERGRDAPAMDHVRATSGAAGTGDETAVDLTGIDPVHWAETRERVAILRAWCANGRHPRSEAVAAAARMGVTVSHFYRLVAAWKKHHDARLVSGHPARRGDERAARSVDGSARAVVMRVVGDSGPEARFTDVMAEVRKECAAAGVTPPSSNMVHKTMMRRRQSAVGEAVGQVDDVAVAVVGCLLPVTVDGRTIDAPDLVLAVERPGGAIVGHALSIDGDVVGAARPLIARLTAGSATGEGGRILVASTLAGAVDAGPAGTEASSSCTGDGRQVETTTRSTLLSATLGSYIDSVPIRHRRRPALTRSPWTPLSPADAVTAIDMAVAAHNAMRRG